MEVRYSVAALGAAVALSACGAAKTITVTTTVTQTQTTTRTITVIKHGPAKTTRAATTTPAATSAATPSVSTSSNLNGPMGTPFTDTDPSGNVMSVVLTQLIDPAQGVNEASTPNHGFRFVGAKFTITGKSGTFSDDANNDAAVVGSDGQTYTADFSEIAGCTNFNHGTYAVTPGTSAAGCVVFQVPDGVKVASVQWGGQFGGSPATWNP